MPAPVASGWSGFGWALHPLESAAFSRRTPEAVVRGAVGDADAHTTHGDAREVVAVGVEEAKYLWALSRRVACWQRGMPA